MTTLDKNIIESSFPRLKRLSSSAKLKLIKELEESIKSEKNDEKKREERFYNSFGAWEDDRSAEEIIADLKASRKFRERDINLDLD